MNLILLQKLYVLKKSKAFAPPIGQNDFFDGGKRPMAVSCLSHRLNRYLLENTDSYDRKE